MQTSRWWRPCLIAGGPPLKRLGAAGARAILQHAYLAWYCRVSRDAHRMDWSEVRIGHIYLWERGRTSGSCR